MNLLSVNIGTEKCCLFVTISMRLLTELDEKPLLYYTIEEALECKKIGYYGIGIIAFSQLLNLFGEKAPQHRHLVAHELLTKRPTREMFEQVIEAFRNAAAKQSEHELKRYKSAATYKRHVLTEWNKFIKKLHKL